MGSHRKSQQLAAFTLFIATLACLFLPTKSYGYIDLAPTLAKVISDSRQIAVVEVDQYDAEHRLVVLKPVRMLKGDTIVGPIRHRVITADGAPVPRQILQWAAPGARGVLFASRGNALVCIGESWYQVRGTAAADSGKVGVFALGADRPDLPLAFCGTVSRLAAALELMLAGKDATITTVPHGAQGEAASFDLALNRFNIPGFVKVQRLRTNLKMSGPNMASSANPAYVLGQGPVDEADLPNLIESLSSPDASVRAETAEDLRSLGAKARSATPSLNKLLADPTARVRLAAASAMLRISRKDTDNATPLAVLAEGMTNSDAAVRRDAAKAVGLSGRSASPLTDELAELLKDVNQPVRITALQAISVLGPTAAKAVSAIAPLLDNPDLMTDAADALGRIGTAARPIPPALSRMLASPQKPVQLAALCAMAQIGGPESHPAVEYMMKALPNSSEIDGYNMMIYLSLLGPDAIDAEQVVRNVRIKNPVLPSATLWALAPAKYLPWQSGGRQGFGGGPGGGGGVDIFGAIYDAYVDELGERLHLVAPILARKIMDGTAGNIPDWGYRILACGPADALNVLMPHLTDADIASRERAVVAIGYMGPAAAPAKEVLHSIFEKAPTEREKNLIQWTLRKIDVDE